MARPLLSVLKEWVTFSNASPKATKEKSLVIQLLGSMFDSFGVYLHVAKTRKRSGNQRVCRITGMLLQRTEIHDLVETSLVKQEGVLVPFMAHVIAGEVEPPELLVTSTSYLIPFRRNPSCGGPCTIYTEVVDVDGLKEFLRCANRDLEHAKAACANADVEVEGTRLRDIIKKKAQVAICSNMIDSAGSEGELRVTYNRGFRGTGRRYAVGSSLQKGSRSMRRAGAS